MKIKDSFVKFIAQTVALRYLWTISVLNAQTYEQTSTQRIFPFSNLNSFPFKPKETKIRDDNFYEPVFVTMFK